MEDITVRVKAQSFSMVRFVRGSRCSERPSKPSAVVKMEDPRKRRSSENNLHPNPDPNPEAEARAQPRCPPSGPDSAACHFTLHPGLHRS